MDYPDDANGDVFRRLEAAHFDFTGEHTVDFFAIFSTEEAADAVARVYLEEHRRGNRLAKLEINPSEEGGMELSISKKMYVTYESVTSFENTLGMRVREYGGRLDGWGVLQE